MAVENMPEVVELKNFEMEVDGLFSDEEEEGKEQTDAELEKIAEEIEEVLTW